MPRWSMVSGCLGGQECARAAGCPARARRRCFPPRWIEQRRAPTRCADRIRGTRYQSPRTGAGLPTRARSAPFHELQADRGGPTCHRRHVNGRVQADHAARVTSMAQPRFCDRGGTRPGTTRVTLDCAPRQRRAVQKPEPRGCPTTPALSSRQADAEAPRQTRSGGNLGAAQ